MTAGDSRATIDPVVSLSPHRRQAGRPGFSNVLIVWQGNDFVRTITNNAGSGRGGDGVEYPCVRTTIFPSDMRGLLVAKRAGRSGGEEHVVPSFVSSSGLVDSLTIVIFVHHQVPEFL